MNNNNTLLTVNEVAAYMKIVPLTVRRMIDRGDLKAIKVGRVWRIRQEDLQDYLARSASRRKEDKE